MGAGGCLKECKGGFVGWGVKGKCGTEASALAVSGRCCSHCTHAGESFRGASVIPALNSIIKQSGRGEHIMGWL